MEYANHVPQSYDYLEFGHEPKSLQWVDSSMEEKKKGH